MDISVFLQIHTVARQCFKDVLNIAVICDTSNPCWCVTMLLIPQGSAEMFIHFQIPTNLWHVPNNIVICIPRCSTLQLHAVAWLFLLHKEYLYKLFPSNPYRHGSCFGTVKEKGGDIVLQTHTVVCLCSMERVLYIREATLQIHRGIQHVSLDTLVFGSAGATCIMQ